MDERSPYSGREIVGEFGEVDLYSSDDGKVGRILEVNPQFIVVERGGGFLFQSAAILHPTRSDRF